MKPTGVVRKVDELGRIVLPISIRQTMEISSGDAVEIFTDDGRIILQKYQPACVFCNNADNIVFFIDFPHSMDLHRKALIASGLSCKDPAGK